MRYRFRVRVPKRTPNRRKIQRFLGWLYERAYWRWRFLECIRQITLRHQILNMRDAGGEE